MDGQGFSIVERLIAPDAIARTAAAMEQSGLSRTKAGARHVLQVPAVRDLASDARLIAIASRWLNAEAFPFRATLFDKSLSSNWLVAWHQDTALPIVKRTDDPAWGPWTMKAGVLHAVAPARALDAIIALRVHLDDCTSANGPLRVLPSTHCRGVLDRSTIEQLAATVAPVVCTTNAGGIVAMRPLIVHASSRVRVDRPRRVLHIEYASGVRLDHDVELAVG
jgi:Phytanoyl-CoA dioxygenase (PhyH)